MNPLFVYRKQIPGSDLYLVRGLDEDQDAPGEGYKLVASIEPRAWFQCFLNYDKKERGHMLRELEGK